MTSSVDESAFVQGEGEGQAEMKKKMFPVLYF